MQAHYWEWGVKAEDGKVKVILHYRTPTPSQEKKDDLIFWVSMVTEVDWDEWTMDTCPPGIPSTHCVSVQ